MSTVRVFMPMNLFPCFRVIQENVSSKCYHYVREIKLVCPF